MPPAGALRVRVAPTLRRVARKLTAAPVHALVPLLLAALWALAIRGVDVGEMTDLGLVSVLPVSVFALLAALAISFAVSLFRRPFEPIVPLVHVVVLIVFLYGLTAFIEPEPRFATAWKHAGIVDYIDTHRSVDPNIDAYFNWPGYFVLGVMITNVAGFDTALSYAAWAPLAFNLLFLAPLIAIFRWASSDPRVVWLGAWIFYCANWVGQDYMAPQAVAFLTWLSILSILLVWFAKRGSLPFSFPRGLDLRGLLAKWRRSLRSRGDARTSDTLQRVALLLVVIAMYAAMTTGHQLTPFPVLVSVAGLALIAGLQTRVLPIIMGLMLAAWIGYMTTTYLAGHLDILTGSVGSVGSTLDENVSARVAGNADHVLVVQMRAVMTGAILALAFAGFLRRLFGRRIDLTVALLAATPFVLPVLQPYGGEVLIRVFLFSLPGVSFLVARLVFPSVAAGRGALAAAAVATLSCFLLAGFQFTRYGNERAESFTKGDVATVRALYRHAPRGSVIVAATGNIPWQYRDYAAYRHREVDRLDAWRNSTEPDPRALIRQLESEYVPQGGYLIVTRSTRIDAAVNIGKPGALERLVRLLHRYPGARTVYRGGGGEVFFMRGAA